MIKYIMFFIVPPPAGTLSDSEAVRLAFEEFTMTLDDNALLF